MISRRVLSIVLAISFVAVLAGCHQNQAGSATLDEQLLMAAEKGDVKAAERSLKKGANVNARDRGGWTSLALSAGRGDAVMTKLLLDHGADTGARDSNDSTPLAEALAMGSAPVVELLLQKGADKDSLNQALFLVLTNQPIFMREETAEKNITIHSDQDPFAKVIKVLLEKGANVEARDEDGNTPLITASAYGRLGSAELLLQSGADIEAKNKYGSTALLAAACDCAIATMPDTYDVVNLLLKNGAQIDARDQGGDTALTIASGGGEVKTEIVRLLIERGADIRIRNARGETALMIARKSNVSEVVKLLKSATAKSH